MHKLRLAKRIVKDWDYFKSIKKAINCESKKKSDTFLLDSNVFADKLIKIAHDIRCTDNAYKKRMESDFNLKMIKDDDAFYMDNCHSPYKAFCSKTVPKDWERKQKRKIERQESDRRKVAEMETETAEQ